MAATTLARPVGFSVPSTNPSRSRSSKYLKPCTATTVVDEVHGFKYFDERDLLGFVDGTENPTGPDAIRVAVIGADDETFAGGSYVIVQKYLHDLAAWDA